MNRAERNAFFVVVAIIIVCGCVAGWLVTGSAWPLLGLLAYVPIVVLNWNVVERPTKMEGR